MIVERISILRRRRWVERVRELLSLKPAHVNTIPGELYFMATRAIRVRIDERPDIYMVSGDSLNFTTKPDGSLRLEITPQ